MDVMSKIAKHVIYSGQVQGVGFRFTSERIARRYDIAGFVKNLPSGQVEMVVQGKKRDVEDYLGEIDDTFGGGITDKKVEDISVKDKYVSFNIAY